jgi:hypothetical protein
MSQTRPYRLSISLLLHVRSHIRMLVRRSLCSPSQKDPILWPILWPGGWRLQDQDGITVGRVASARAPSSSVCSSASSMGALKIRDKHDAIDRKGKHHHHQSSSPPCRTGDLQEWHPYLRIIELIDGSPTSPFSHSWCGVGNVVGDDPHASS